MTADRIRRAAEILRERAQELFSGHTVPHTGRWSHHPADQRAKTDHDEMLSLAAELDTLAGER